MPRLHRAESIGEYSEEQLQQQLREMEREHELLGNTVQPTITEQAPFEVTDLMDHISSNPPEDLWGTGIVGTRRFNMETRQFESVEDEQANNELASEPIDFLPSIIEEEPNIGALTAICPPSNWVSLSNEDITPRCVAGSVGDTMRENPITTTVSSLGRDYRYPIPLEPLWTGNRSDDVPRNVDRRCVVRADRKQGIESVKTE
jgi:hypothetical protein